MESAAAGPGLGMGRVARQARRNAAGGGVSYHGEGADQGFGVGVAGCGEGSAAEPSSTIRPAYITATRSVTWARTERSWVMTIRARFLLAELCQEVQDLGLYHDVERRRWLVGDHQRRVARQGHGDHDPLAHAAGELVRVVASPARRDAHVLEELPHAAAGLALETSS